MTNESPPKQTLQNMLSIYLNNLIGLDQTSVPEMEIRFGTARNMKPISRLEYDNVIKRLLSNQFELSVSQHLLRINTEYTDIKTGATKLSNIRAELSGMGNISKYCNITLCLHRKRSCCRTHVISAILFRRIRHN